jgi:hypothetical protein
MKKFRNQSNTLETKWDRKTVQFTPGQVVFDKEDKVFRQIDMIVSLDYESILGEFKEPVYTFVGDVGFYVPESEIRKLYIKEREGFKERIPSGWLGRLT